MSVFLDTSVLVPVFLADHPHHTASIELFARCRLEAASCAAHSLAEVYSTLTRIPLPYRATAVHALKCVLEISQRVRLVSLTGQEYLEAIQNASTNGIYGGTIYDALIVKCAIQSDADQIYTWNTRHFSQFGPEVTRRLTLPGS